MRGARRALGGGPGGGAEEVDQVGGRLERVGDHGAGLERHGGGDLAPGGGDEDLAVQRAGGVEAGEADQGVGVDVLAGRTRMGVIAGLLWGRREAMETMCLATPINTNDPP